MQIPLLGASGLVFAGCLVLAVSPLSLQAQLPKTIRVFTTPAVGTAQAAFTGAVGAARKAYGQALETSLKGAMSSGNLAEANSINGVKTALNDGSAMPPTDFKTPSATQAKATYEAAITRARTQYFAVLQAAQKSVLASGDLKEANSLQEEINDISGASQPAAAGNAPAAAPGGGATIESADLLVTGSGFSVATLEDAALAWGNRAYRWAEIPPSLRGAQYTKTNGGAQPKIKIKAKRDTTVQVIVAFDKGVTKLPAGWDRTGIHFITNGNNAEIIVYKKKLRLGEEVDVPQVSWSGTLVVVPGK